MNFEAPQFQSSKPQEESWEDIYGETEIEFGPGGKVKITERKSGKTEEKILEKSDDPFYSLPKEKQEEVIRRLKEYEESDDLKHLSPRDRQEAIVEKRRQISQEMLLEEKSH